MQAKTIPDGPQALKPVAGFAKRQLGASSAYGLEQDLDAACGRIAAHDGKRPSHGTLGIALQVYEVSGCSMLCTPGCFQCNDELSSSQRFMVGHASTFFKDGVLPDLHACMVTGVDCSIGFELEHRLASQDCMRNPAFEPVIQQGRVFATAMQGVMAQNPGPFRIHDTGICMTSHR